MNVVYWLLQTDSGVPVKLDDSWGLDHGTWSVLRPLGGRGRSWVASG